MADIEKFPVTSSNIGAIGYDEKTETLKVWFKFGGIYEYAKVPAQEYRILKAHVSVGSYFASNIKGKYSFIKVNA